MSEQKVAPSADAPGSTSAARDNPDALLQVFLAEYNSLRQEMNTRLQAHHQTFNYLIVVIGAAVAATVAASTATKSIWLLLDRCHPAAADYRAVSVDSVRPRDCFEQLISSYI
jgi:hypothetical protein